MSKKRPPKMPSGLGPEGRKHWKASISEFDFEVHHPPLLESAARQLDRQATARADVEKNGVTILDRFGIAKENPAVAIERQAAMAFVRIMRELNLDAEKPEESRAPRLPGGRY